MSPRRARRLAAGIIVALIAATLLPPFINANRFRNRLAETMRLSLGRDVQMGNLYFTLLPRPGFVIENLVIADDPAFSAEPVLRAGSVTAALRLTSLWRGRLELAQLSFDYPSLNLVRNAEGRWNLESVLMQASSVPAAPTGTPRPESRPRFPYIEASNGRINLRQGQEKLPHTLMEADFSLWLEAENQWNMRLEGRPTRTDAYLSDTGTVRMAGQFRRAATPGATPIRVDIEVERAQLGQATSLLTGRDRGWRGSTDITARLDGTARDFNVTATAEVTDFHRHDISTRDSLNARITCQGNVAFQSSRTTFECTLPIGKGAATVEGFVATHSYPDYDVAVAFREAPMASFANFMRRIKRDVPADLRAEGTFNGKYRLARTAGVSEATGAGRVTGLILSSEARGIALSVSSFDAEFPQPKKGVPPRMELNIGSAGMRLGGRVPVYVAARVTPAEISAEARGDADLKQLLAAAGLFGLADPRYQVTGFATFQLGVTGKFEGFAPPVVTGTALVRDVTTTVDGVAAPIVMQTAAIDLRPEAIVFDKAGVRLEGSSAVVAGRIVIPRHCPSNGCVSTFDLRTPELNLDEVNRVLNPRYRSSAWLSLPSIFAGKPVKTSRLMTLQARGTINIGRLVIKDLVANRAVAQLTFDRGKLEVADLQAELQGGKHKGTWRADLTGDEPVFSGQGSVEGLPLTQVNALLRSPLGTGTAKLTYELELRGSDAATLRRTASGTAGFRWTNGTWRTGGAAPAMQFSDWTGSLRIQDEVADLTSSVMQTRGGPYQVSGRAGFDRKLSLRLSGPRDQILLTGTMQAPVVAVEPAETLPARDSASKLPDASLRKTRN